MMDGRFDDKHHRCKLTRYLKKEHWSRPEERVLPYLPLVLSVAVINGYKLKAYIYKSFTFLLNTSCLVTFPYLRISLSWLYTPPGFGVNSSATVKLKE